VTIRELTLKAMTSRALLRATAGHCHCLTVVAKDNSRSLPLPQLLLRVTAGHSHCLTLVAKGGECS